MTCIHVVHSRLYIAICMYVYNGLSRTGTEIHHDDERAKMASNPANSILFESAYDLIARGSSKPLRVSCIKKRVNVITQLPSVTTNLNPSQIRRWQKGSVSFSHVIVEGFLRHMTSTVKRTSSDPMFLRMNTLFVHLTAVWVHVKRKSYVIKPITFPVFTISWFVCTLKINNMCKHRLRFFYHVFTTEILF